jgi:hypothetical protein
MIAEEILDFLPVCFNSVKTPDEDHYQDLKNIASCSRVKISEGILEKNYLYNNG